jgi:transposase-like protein
MEKRVLISVFTVSALLFGLFCVFPLSSALSDDTKMKDDEDLLRSFPMMDRNRNKRAIGAALGIGISILSFVASNIRQTFDNSGAKKSHQELISHFEQIHEQLEQQKEELESINREIKKLASSVNYFQHEENIKVCLWNLRKYLHDPNEQNRKRFIDKAADVDHSIRVLIDGLLGQNTFGSDIMDIIRDATEVSI